MRRRSLTPRSAWILVALTVVAACSGGGDDRIEPGADAVSTTSTTSTSTSVFDQVLTSINGTEVASATPNATTIAPALSTTTTTRATTIASTAPLPSEPPIVQPTPTGVSPCPPTGARVWDVHPASDIPAPPLPEGWRTESAGTSVQGRDLAVLVRPVDAPIRTVMVIGGIHGNEPVSPPAVRAMVDADIPADTEVWLLPLLNPDGSAVGTRCNASGVDLNRNFSWTWRADDGGPAAFSEPESSAAAALVERVDPDLVVWVHQPLGYVSSIGATPDSYERTWANASGVPVRADVSQHGGGESWTAYVAGLPSMLIEVDTYDARPDMVAAHLAGFAALLDVVTPR